jgi:high-affinity Fe2+/Pb2+ permease
MTYQDLFEKGVSVAKEIGATIQSGLSTLYAKDNEVIGKYALILAIAGLLIFGLRLLSDEVEEYRGREENKSRKLPWYLRYWTLFLVIIFLYTIIFVLIL